MTDHTDLIRRLEEAEAGGRALDADVFAALGFTYDHGPADVWRDAGGDPFYFDHITTSIDAAAALVERMLPGVSVGLTIHPDTATEKTGSFASLDYGDDWIGKAIASAPSLALVAATLRALQSKGEG